MEATLTVKLPDALRRQARSVAAQRGQTISEIVRRALQQYVEDAQVERKTLAAEISKQPQSGLVAAGHFFSRAVWAGRHNAGCNRRLRSA